MSTVLIEKNILTNGIERLADALPVQYVAVVFDDKTYEVLASDLMASLGGRYRIKPIALGKPRASVNTAEHLRKEAAECQAIIAVGSGTINDLCKYVSYRLGIAYAVFATAPSMNGYTSSTASLIFGKHKSSVQAHQPVAVYADPDILCRAPSRLIRAGLGDVLCRTTVQTDWLLSHLLFGTPYDASLFERLLPLEAEMIVQSKLLQDRDPTFIKLLMKMLIISGNAMHAFGSSAPASQGEHMVAHNFDMLYGEEQGFKPFHGEQIAVTSVALSRIQDKLLLKKPRLKKSIHEPDKFNRLFRKPESEALYESYTKKALDEQQIEALEEKLNREWSDIKEQIEAVRIKTIVLENTLKKAGCPTRYSDIRWHKDRFEHALTTAYLTRDRFTFLDLAAMDISLRFSF